MPKLASVSYLVFWVLEELYVQIETDWSLPVDGNFCNLYIFYNGFC